MVIRAGWKYDSYRHSLASRGLKSRYLATKQINMPPEVVRQSKTTEPKQSDESTANQEIIAKRAYELTKQQQVQQDAKEKKRKEFSPKTELQYIAAAEAAERIATSKEIESRTVNRVKDLIARGDLTGNVTLRDGTVLPLSEAIGKLNGFERDSAVAELHNQALVLARNGQELPKELQPFVAKYQNQINTEKAAFKRANESELSKDLKNAAIGTVGAVGAAGEFTGRAAVNVAGYGAQGVAEDISLMQEAKSGPIGQTSGVVNPLLEDPAKTKGMFNTFGFLPEGKSKPGKTPNQAVSDEVDELYNAREQMSEVNLKAYDEGLQAFKKGDRENMIKSITALDAEEKRLLDNYNLVEQTRSIVLSPRYRAAAYLEDDGIWSMFAGGGKMLAERTKKVNDVKMMIAQRKHEIDTRKGLLKYKLQKMDAIIPPDYSEPNRNIDVINQKKQMAVQIPDQLKPNGYFTRMLGREEPGE